MSERPGSPVRRLVPLLLAAALLAKSAAPPPAAYRRSTMVRTRSQRFARKRAQ